MNVAARRFAKEGANQLFMLVAHGRILWASIAIDMPTSRVAAAHCADPGAQLYRERQCPCWQGSSFGRQGRYEGVV